MMAHTGEWWSISANLFVPGTDTRLVSAGHSAAGRTGRLLLRETGGTRRSLLREGFIAMSSPFCTIEMLATRNDISRSALAEAAAGRSKSNHNGLYKNVKWKKKDEMYINGNYLCVGGDILTKPSKQWLIKPLMFSLDSTVVAIKVVVRTRGAKGRNCNRSWMKGRGKTRH